MKSVLGQQKTSSLTYWRTNGCSLLPWWLPLTRQSHQPTKPQRHLLLFRNVKSEEVCDRQRWRRQSPHWSRVNLCHPSLQESDIDTPKMSKSEMAEKMHCHDMWTGDTILTRRNMVLSAVKEGRHILCGKDSQSSCLRLPRESRIAGAYHWARWSS